MKLVRGTIVVDCQTLRDDIRQLQADISEVKTDASRASRLRRTAYVSGIVQTYGLLEQSIDRLIVAIALAYNEIHALYDDIPERVRQEFRRLALQSLVDGDRARLREPVDEDAVLSAINTTTTASLRKLIPPVFTRSQANYRHPQVREMLGRLDVKVDPPSSNGVQACLDSLGMAKTDSVVFDLVERRNALAHAYAVPDSILGIDQMLAMLDVVENYLLSVEETANTRLLQECENSGRLTIAGTVARRWSRAIGIDVVAGNLEVGDALLFRRKGGRYLSRAIDSLRLDGTNVDCVKPITGTAVLQVGVGLSHTAPLQLEGATVLLVPEALRDLLPERGT